MNKDEYSDRVDTVDLMLTLERPTSAVMNGVDRGKKYKMMRQNSEHLRDDLLKWLDEQGLANDVVEVGEATAFNTLFVKTTNYVAEMITTAPGVVDVAFTNGVHFEVTQVESKKLDTKQDTKPSAKQAETKNLGESSVTKRSHIVGISEIVLWTADQKKAVHFYHDLLKLEIMSPPEMPNVFLKVGEGQAGIPQMIVLVPKNDEIQAQPAGYQLHHLAFELPPEQFDNQFDALVAAGFAPRDGIHPVLSSRTMYVDDPDGNEIEFICYADHA